MGNMGTRRRLCWGRCTMKSWFYPALIAIVTFSSGAILTDITNSPDYFYLIFFSLAVAVEVILIATNKFALHAVSENKKDGVRDLNENG